MRSGCRTRRTTLSSAIAVIGLLAVGCSGSPTGAPPSSEVSAPDSTRSASPVGSPTTNALSPVFRIDVPDPSDIELAFGSIWTGNHHQNSITRIDPDSGEILATIPKVGYQVLALVEADGSLWAGSAFDGMVRIDPETNEVTAKVEGQFADLALGFGSLWATTFDHRLRRIDPASGEILATIRFGSGQSDVRSWVTVDDAHQTVWIGVGDGTSVYRLDPKSNEIVGVLGRAGDDPRVLTAGGSTWILSVDDGELHRVDPNANEVIANSKVKLSTAEFCAPRSVPGDGIWFACSDGLLYQFDALSGRIEATFDLSEGHGYGAGGGIGFDGSFVWTASTIGQFVRAFELPYAPTSGPA
jgi:streptogramin lyase